MPRETKVTKQTDPWRESELGFWLQGKQGDFSDLPGVKNTLLNYSPTANGTSIRLQKVLWRKPTASLWGGPREDELRCQERMLPADLLTPLFVQKVSEKNLPGV